MRIGIVGSDNSHAIAYSTLANVQKRFGDTRVTMIAGVDPARTQEVAETGEIEQIVSGPEDMIGAIDAAIVVHRHGDLHARHTIPLLEAGIPVYVDKPFAISLADCAAMVDAAAHGGTWVTSYSNLRYTLDTVELEETAGLGEVRAAQFAGPCDFDSEYGGAFFYATHVADIMLRLLGNDIERVSAIRHGARTNVNVTFTGGAVASILYANDVSYHFTATLFGTEGYTHREIATGNEAYAAAMQEFLTGVESNKPPLDQSTLDLPIRFTHAVLKSLEQDGCAVKFSDIDGDSTATGMSMTPGNGGAK